MVHETAKPRVSRFKHSLVPFFYEPIPRSLTNSHSMHLDVAFMDRTDSAKKLGHHSVLAQHMEYNKPISRTLMPNIQRRFEDQGAPLLGSRSTERPSGGLEQADKQGQLTRLESSKGGTEDAIKLVRTRRNISQDHLSQIFGGTVVVSMIYPPSWSLSLIQLTDNRFTMRRVVTVLYKPRLWNNKTRQHCPHGTGSYGLQKLWRWV